MSDLVQNDGHISKQKCIRGGYTPHRTPFMSNRKYWHVYYKQELIDMYILMKDIMDDRYIKNGISWTSNKTFNDFSQLIFQSSSQYIDG